MHRNTPHACRRRRMEALLSLVEMSKLPEKCIPVFHSRKTFFKRCPVRFLPDVKCPSSVNDVLDYLQDKHLLIVKFDENDNVTSWTEISGRVISSPGMLMNESKALTGRWYLRRYNGADLLSSMRPVDGRETDNTLFTSETVSLRDFVKGLTA